MQSPSYPPPVLPSECYYTPYYCEENIYFLAASFHQDNITTNAWEISVVFVSNESKTVALWGQKLSLGPDYPVVWDYHCILVLRPRLNSASGPAWVYDYDTCLAIPCCWSGESYLIVVS
jgi:protein N-terminal glutamine amidohydrolase